jgi:hypothetical protein
MGIMMFINIGKESQNNLPKAAMSPLGAYITYLISSFIFTCFIMPWLIKYYDVIIEQYSLFYNHPVMQHSVIKSFFYVTLYMIALIFLSASFNTRAMGAPLLKPKKYEHSIICWQKQNGYRFCGVVALHYIAFIVIDYLGAIIFDFKYYPKFEDNYIWDLYILALVIISGIYLAVYMLITCCSLTRIMVDPWQYYVWRIDVDYEMYSQSDNKTQVSEK